MISEARNDKVSNSENKKITYNLILEILKYFKPKDIGRFLTLNKALYQSLSSKFQTVNFSVENSDCINLMRKDINTRSTLNNIKISVKLKNENKRNILFMLQLQKNIKDRLGVIPLFYNNITRSYNININENKYCSVFKLLKSRNFETFNFRAELITDVAYQIEYKQINLSITSFLGNSNDLL
jgi:hypothetical protein